MEFSKNFYGWVGRTADSFTFRETYKIAYVLANYYKRNSSSGQKLIIGYDTRTMAREFAEFLSIVFAENGIKVFLSNQPVPSPVLLCSALQKKAMGAITITGDELTSKFLGFKAFDNNGFSLDVNQLEKYIPQNTKAKKVFDFEIKKWINNGFIEPFDPSFCFENYVYEKIDFSESSPNVNRILYNPLYGSGLYYFHKILKNKKMLGYNIDSEHVFDLKRIEPIPSSNVVQMMEDMVFHGTELGFITSPDCTYFEFAIKNQHLTSSQILYLIAEHLLSQNKTVNILVSKGAEINVDEYTSLNVNFNEINQSDFYSELKKKEHMVAVDDLGRFYFEYHGSPDALMVGFYLAHILNIKNNSLKHSYAKIENIK